MCETTDVKINLNSIYRIRDETTIEYLSVCDCAFDCWQALGIATLESNINRRVYVGVCMAIPTILCVSVYVLLFNTEHEHTRQNKKK